MKISLQRILQAHQAGRHEEADAGYRQLVRANPRHADAWHLWGVLAAQRKQHGQAIERIRRALQLQPGEPAFLGNLGNVHRERGEPGEAIRCFRAALHRAPEDQALVRTLARVCEERLDAGIAHQQAGRLEEAEACYGDVLIGQPERADAWHLLGTIALEREEYEKAEDQIRRALALKPTAAIFHNSLGAVLQKAGRAVEAMEQYRRAVALDPRLASAHTNQAQILTIRRDLRQAELACEKALELRPGDVAALSTLAGVRERQGRLREAIELCEQVLAREPGRLDAAFSLGQILYRRRSYTRALQQFHAVAARDADYPGVLGWIAMTAARLCQWTDDENLRAKLIRKVGEGSQCTTPFAFLNVCDDPFLQRRCAELRAAPVLQAAEPADPRPPLATGERIRLAYVSPDFRRHPLAYLIADLIERHDRSRFELIGVSLSPPREDPWRQRLQRGFDHFLEVEGVADAEVADRMRGMGIHIAVDLAGFTADSRPGILAARAAPIQVNWLGFPATMGAPFIDHILADRYVIPAELRQAYSEEVVWLPDTFQPAAQRHFSDASPSRVDLGLPEEGLVFCCFCTAYKIRPAIFTVWMRLLEAVPGSVLWLAVGAEEARTNLRREAEIRGVDPARLVFISTVALPDYLVRYRLADLFLDTFPYNAGTTASDALWAGLPVISCSGRAFVSRMAGSLLQAAGLPELVTESLADYEAMVLRLAQHPEELAAVRARLAKNRDTAPLYDVDRFRRSIEAAYEAMVQRWRGGRAPASFQDGSAEA